MAKGMSKLKLSINDSNVNINLCGSAALREYQDAIQHKLTNIRRQIRKFGSAAVAFSAGVDSTFLLRVAHDELAANAIAVTVRMRSCASTECESAIAFCRDNAIRHFILDIDEFSIPHFAENPPDRCYHCKKAIFSRILSFARENGLSTVLEGTNSDDDGDYRPGRRALAELGILSPLHDADLSKKEIRALSHQLGLATADKPSNACLASRFPYGTPITPDGLDRVAKAEAFIHKRLPDLRQLRVRSHADGVARIEIPAAYIPQVAACATEIHSALHSLGFTYIALDLHGYRTGSLNERLTQLPFH